MRGTRQTIIVGGAVGSLALLCWLGMTAFGTLKQYRDSAEGASVSRAILSDGRELRDSLQEASDSALAYHHSGLPKLLPDYARARQQIEKSVSGLHKDLNADERRRQQANTIALDTEALLEQMDAYAGGAPARTPEDTADETIRIREPRDRILVQIDSILVDERQSFGVRREQMESQLFRSLLILGGGCAVCVVLLGLAAWLSVANARQRMSAEQQLRSLLDLQRSIYESTGQMILACDLEGRLIAFNPSAERLLGFHATEIIGKYISEIHPQAEVPRVAQRLGEQMGRTSDHRLTPQEITDVYIDFVRSYPASEVPEIEMRYRRKDGSTFPGMVALSAIRDTSGKVTGFVAVATDITSRKRAEYALRESEERYRDLFEHSNEMIATLSPAGRYLYVNPSWQQKLGYTSAELDGLGFETAFPPELQAEAAATLRRALAGEVLEEQPLRMVRKSGAMLEVEAAMSRRTEDGRPVSVRCIFRDITELRRRERRLRAQLAVSQVVAESSTVQQAMPRVLEALASNLGWDVADLCMVDEEQHVLRWEMAWTSQAAQFEEFRRDSAGRVFSSGQGLPGRIWASGMPVWVDDMQKDENLPRRFAALATGLHTAWGVPVRVGNRVIATIQFFGVQRMPEDAGLMATVETACASLGQFIARSIQEARANELNRQKESILNTVADGIIGTDPAGRAVFINPAAARLLSATLQELVGRDVHSILHEYRNDDEDCDERCRLSRSLLMRESSNGQEVVYRRDGSHFPVDFSATPMVEHGVVVGSVVTFRDISQRYALDRMKDEFVSTVSHELRTPLTSIRGALGLLSAGLLGDVSDKAANLLRIAISNTDRLVRLINDILDLERMTSGRAPLHFRTLNFTDLVQQSVDTMTAMADTAGVKLVFEPMQAEAEADPDRILQVLTNLLSNAIKFSPPESKVRVTLERRGESLLISVMDEGRGIPEDKLETVFERFQQVDASDARQKGGTGLGLAICRTILQQHGGRIWAETNPIRGTTFRFILPEKHAPLSEPAPKIALHEMLIGGETILVCDDEAPVRAVMRHHLEHHGYNVIEAENGEQAINLARQRPVDAILLDLNMPGMSGWEVLNRLKEDPVTAGTPVVVVSVCSQQETPQPLEETNGWVQKPFNDQILLSELGRALRGTTSETRLLLVEDDIDLARVVIAIFERAGLHVHHADTKSRAIELCQQVQPDLMILDLTLPDGDGLSIVDWLRQHSELHKMPLVVYSARDISEAEMDKLRLGPTQFLTKAKVQPKEVESLVLTMLRRYRDRSTAHTATFESL